MYICYVTTQKSVARLDLGGEWISGGNHSSAVKGSAIDLEAAGSGLVSCRFSFPSLSYHV